MRASLIVGSAAMFGALIGCTSSEDRALERVHAADAKLDQIGAAFDRVHGEYMRIAETCEPAQPCAVVLTALHRKSEELYAQYEQALVESDRAERDLDYASAAADRRAARGAAMMGAGAALLGSGQPQAPITCRTSNTTMPTTICQ